VFSSTSKSANALQRDKMKLKCSNELLLRSTLYEGGHIFVPMFVTNIINPKKMSFQAPRFTHL
jgi:hypothetical protein